MGRRSMDELLTAFDPLHSSSASGSVQAGPSRSPAREASSSMDNSSSFSDARHAQASQHAAIPLSQAPLDLLSLDDDPRTAQPWPSTSASAAGAHPQGPAAISRQPVQGGLQANASHDIQARAAKRQDGLLSELHNADQTFTIPSSHASTSASTHGQGHAAASPPAARPGTRHRRTSSGFSPPRRMSRSGLMHDEHAINQLRAAHQHPGPPHLPMDGGFVPSSPSTSLTEEPAVLFHPFSPPDGTTLETLRNSDYFPAQHAPYTRTTIPPPHAASNSNYSTADRPVSTGERQRRTSSSDRQALRAFRDGESQTSDNQVGGISTETTKKQPSNRTAFIQNTLRGPLPPFSSPSLKQTASSQAQPIPSTSNAHPPSASPQPSVNAPSSPSSRFKSIRKATFDFPSFSSLGSSVPTSSGKGSSIPAQPPQTKSGSNTPSPANSLVIDSDPLPSLTLKVSGSARESRRVLTEDIADGIRTALPPRIKLCKSWTLLYSIDAHGTSLTTLYTRVQAGLQKSAGGCVLVVKDMEGGIFGAYVNEAFKRSESYYGNGECFIWKVESFPPGDNFRVGPIVRSYRWTARNDYIILSDSSFLGIGGGDGKFGLWLDSSFDKGFTTSCPAFANEPLCSDSLIRPGVDGNPEGKFEIMAVECWAVG